MALGTNNLQPFQIAVAILGFLGFAIVLLSTSRYGVGISPDSTNYAAAARSLISGDGYRYYDGSPYVHFGPLFPTLLASLGLLGIDHFDGARVVNALVFGLIVCASGQLFQMYLRARVLMVLATAFVLLSVPLLRVSTMAWTEPLFVLLAVVFAIYMPRFLREQRLGLLLLVSVIAALASLQRYAGITLVVTGVLSIAFATRGLLFNERLRYLTVFSLISTLPILIWVTRNYILTSTFTGSRISSEASLIDNIGYTVGVVTAWLMPTGIASPAKVVIVLLAVFVLAVMAALRWKLKSRSQTEGWSLSPPAIFLITYMLFIVVSSSNVAFDRIDDRLLAPSYVLLILFVFIAIEDTYSVVQVVWPGSRLARLSLVALCALWLLLPIINTYSRVSALTRDGAGGYNTAFWKESSLINWLQAEQLNGMVYSNEPYATYALTGITAHFLPQQPEQLPQFRESLSASSDTYIIWYDIHDFSASDQLEELATALEMEKRATFPDGSVYLVRGKTAQTLWTASGGRAVIQIEDGPFRASEDKDAGYRISYRGVTDTAWAAAGRWLEGLDASGYETLSFYIKGAEGGERPNVYLANGIGQTETRRFVDIEDYVTVTTSWQRLDIPLADFAAQGINLNELSYFQVVFEWEEIEGTIYLDNIHLE